MSGSQDYPPEDSDSALDVPTRASGLMAHLLPAWAAEPARDRISDDYRDLLLVQP